MADVIPRCGADLSLPRKSKFVARGASLYKLIEKPVERAGRPLRWRPRCRLQPPVEAVLRKRLMQNLDQQRWIEVRAEGLPPHYAGGTRQCPKKSLAGFGQQEDEDSELKSTDEIAREGQLAFAAGFQQPPWRGFFCSLA